MSRDNDHNESPPADSKSPNEVDPDAELDAAWQRSPIGIKVNPKRFIKGLIYTEEDKKESKGDAPAPGTRIKKRATKD